MGHSQFLGALRYFKISDLPGGFTGPNWAKQSNAEAPCLYLRLSGAEPGLEPDTALPVCHGAVLLDILESDRYRVLLGFLSSKFSLVQR